jgi:hypothetical protein
MDIQIREEEKDKYIEFLLRQYRLVDALSFLAVEDRFGLEAMRITSLQLTSLYFFIFLTTSLGSLTVKFTDMHLRLLTH